MYDMLLESGEAQMTKISFYNFKIDLPSVEANHLTNSHHYRYCLEYAMLNYNLYICKPYTCMYICMNIIVCMYVCEYK